MSWQHARAVLDIDDMKPAAKLVLIAIALRAGTDGRAWPSVARICADTGFGNSTVRATIRRLAKTGHLQVVHRPGATLLLTLTPPESGGVGAPDIGGTPPDMQEKRARYRREKSKEENKKGATTGSTAMRPAVAENGNGNGRARGWVSTASKAVWVELADGTVVPGTEP